MAEEGEVKDMQVRRNIRVAMRVVVDRGRGGRGKEHAGREGRGKVQI